MKLLITGFSGFVGRHFLECLESHKMDIEVLGVARSFGQLPPAQYRHVRFAHRELDLLDRPEVEDTMATFRPTHVLHLAAYSSVAFSWDRPVASFSNNTNVLLNLLEAVRRLDRSCRVLSVGSSEQYGDVGPTDLPLRESSPLRPISPYGVARVAQEMLSKVYVQGYGLDIVMTRSFNHIGPYQRDAFVVPSIAKQLISIRHSRAEPLIRTGDRAIVRDFVDVRDVVRAYLELLLNGPSGEIYNVCSGEGVRIAEVIEMMRQQVGVELELETDPRLVRPNDNTAIVGCREKIEAATGWVPHIKLSESLSSVLQWWHAKLASQRA
jgi:GDP-4-dehydro-6-deoxy-D-mannose reductase